MSSSPSSSTPPPAPPRAIRPHVLLVLTDQQSLWTISAYHRLLRDGGYASAADFGLGRAGVEMLKKAKKSGGLSFN